jgi:Zn finger protein HypA/HybF involved in hydrogenase expression
MLNNDKQQFSTAFEQGFAAAMDPINASSIQEGCAITTLNSYWLHRHCHKCEHTFRTGDEVYIFKDSTVLHNSNLLACAEKQTITAHRPAETMAFFQGLDITWPPPKDFPLKRLEEGDPLIAPAYAGFQRHTCAVCGHTLRLHDLVVICPCQPQTPMCQIAIHRDPIHGLHCWELWDNWAPDQKRFCPATSRKLTHPSILS